MYAFPRWITVPELIQRAVPQVTDYANIGYHNSTVLTRNSQGGHHPRVLLCAAQPGVTHVVLYVQNVLFISAFVLYILYMQRVGIM